MRSRETVEVDPDQDWSRFRPERGFAAWTRTAKEGKELLSSRKDLNIRYIKRIFSERSFKKNIDYSQEQVVRRRERGVLDSTRPAVNVASFTFRQQHPEICELFFYLCFTPARLDIEDAQTIVDLMGELSCHERIINGLREIWTSGMLMQNKQIQLCVKAPDLIV